jgi:hypothetical protein
MTWSERRRLTYMFFVLAVIALVVGSIAYKITSAPATCADGRQNGTEVGVDCGGICSNYCPNQLADPKVRWARVFPIGSGLAHAVAYIEHGNTAAASRSVGYVFKLYDDKNTLIAERTGTTFLGPMGKSAIVDTLIPIGSKVVSRVQFSFVQPIAWDKVPPAFSAVAIKSDRTGMESDTTGTRLSATLENGSRYNFTNMEVVAILYDANGNAITASKSILPSLPGLSSKEVYFTWPFRIQNAARIEVIPRFNPFTATEV